MRRVLQVCGAITLLTLWLSSQALAKPKPPSVPAGMASVAQYIEVIPTSTGQKQFGSAAPASPAPAEPVPTTTAPAKPVSTAAPVKPAPKTHKRPRHPDTRRPASHVLDGATAPGRLSVVGDVADGVSPLTAIIFSVLGVATVVALFRRPRRPPG